jgi:hypothetical protein
VVLHYLLLQLWPRTKPTELGKPKLIHYTEINFILGLIITYTLNKPVGISQQKISLGVPQVLEIFINKNRNVAIASGLGFALNNYNENCFKNGARY